MNTTSVRIAVRNLCVCVLLLTFLQTITGCSGSYGGGGGGNAPYISGLSVASGPVGTAVTITGSHFGATQGSSTVTFNATAASPTSWSDTSISVPVPTGATTGPVVVTVGGVVSNGMTFTVVNNSSAPTITSLTPNSGAVGISVTIAGTNFGASQGTSTVTFYINKTAAVTTWSATSIVVSVPVGATNGNVVVTVGSVASNGVPFTVTTASAPTIASLTPNSGPVGTSVTIAGSNFGPSQGSSTVTFNGTAATPTSWSATSIVATVPTGATTGNVVVTVAGVASNGVSFTVTTMTASKFPIKLSPNKHYFVDQNNTPWLMVADAAHHLMPVIGSTTASIQQYINSRVAQGFNTINVYGMCAGSGTCPTSGAAQNGVLPFTTGNSNATYDLSTPNPLYWSQVDNVINLANQAGLVVLFEPIPWGVDFGTAMEDVTSPVNYPASDYAFGQFLGNRYKSFPNIIWQFGQDFRHGGGIVGSTWVPVDSTFMDYMAQVIAGVASVDTNHLITSQMNYYASYTQQGLQVACNANCTTNVFWNPRFGNPNNVSFVYSYYETYDEMLQAYNCGPSGPCTIQSNNGTESIGGNSGTTPSSQFPPNVMPTILGESNYEGANNTGFLSSSANAFITRQEMWYAMTSGGAGFEFGQVNVNHFDSSPSWTTMLNTTGTQQVRYVANLLNQFNWWNFVPETTNQIVTAGGGTASPTNANLYKSTHATTTWDGSSAAIIYTPVTATLTVDLAKFTKNMTASWYDPTTGNSMPTSCTSAAPCQNTGPMNFTTPAGPHSDGTNANDWVLVLQ